MNPTPFERLRRRKLFQWGLAYVAASWVLVQVLDVVAEPWGISAGLIRGTQAVLALALPAVLVLAWFHGEKGHQRVTRPEAAILASIVLLSGVVIVVWKPFAEPDAGPAGVATVSVDPNSLLVLPFVNISSDPEQEYMSDGIAEELLNLLAKIPELRVVSRTTAFSFKGRDDITLPEIAAQLGVAHVLEGSVRRSGNTLRITAQLIDARSDTHLFSEAYDRPFDDVFAIQDEIAARVVDELKITLLDEIPRARETDPEVYALFLQAHHVAQFMTFGDQSLDRSMEMLQRVVELDPGYAPAHVALARGYMDLMTRGELSSEEGTQRAVGSAERAVAVDPEYAAARAFLGAIMISRQIGAAEGARQIQRALALAPTDPEVLLAAALSLTALGRFGDAVPVFAYLSDRDPLDMGSLGNLAVTSYYAGRWEEVAAAAREVLALTPGAPQVHSLLGVALLQSGDLEGALAAAELEPVLPLRLGTMAMIHHALGHQVDFQAALDELLELAGPELSVVAAGVYAYAGDADAAFALLEEAPMDVTVVADPVLASLHGDPRWAELMARVEPSVEELASIPLDVSVPR